MNYTRLKTDLETGEVFRISIGEHLTFTEFAEKLNIKRSTLVKAMLEVGLCQTEYDDTAQRNRHRLHPDAESKGLGHRILGPHGPFDVLSPLGREVAEEALRTHLIETCPSQWSPLFEALKEYEQERIEWDGGPMSAQMRFCWLVDHAEDIPPEVIAQGIGVSERLVYRHKGIRESQLEKHRKGLRDPRPSQSEHIEG